MHRRAPASPGIALAVRTQLLASDLREGVLTAAEQRLARLRDGGERGAQAAEYAMLGGVSAAACGALVALLKNDDFLRRILEAIVSGLLKTMKGWF